MIKAAIRYGTILGIIVTLYLTFLYLMGIETFSNFWLWLLVWPLAIFFMVFYTIRIRKNQLGGVMTFGQGFLSSFLIGSIAGIIPLIWGMVIFNVVEPSLQTELPEIIMTQTEEMMENWGAPQEEIDKTLIQQAEDLPKQFTPAGQVIGYFKGLIAYAVLALIIGLITKRSNQSPDNSHDLA